MDLPTAIKSGEPARLIPVVADGKKEQRATSVVLAVIAAVREYGRGVLQAVGAPVRKSSSITCYTEVVFKNQTPSQNLRPDGLIVVETRGQQWKAIIESKIGNAVLDANQIEDYIQLAKSAGVDAVITVSNQFAPRPTHHPVSVPKSKLRSIGLYHWSWTFLMTEAVLVANYQGVSDPEQAYILKELIRYLSHDSSGVSAFTRMPSSWKDLCGCVQQGIRLSKNTPGLAEGVSSWHELARYVALEMTVSVGRKVSVALTRAEAADPVRRVQDDVAKVIKGGTLSAVYEIPDVASRITYSADLLRRTISTSMLLQAPKDRSQARATVTWLLSQLTSCTDDDLIIVAKWPSRAPDTTATLGQLREDKAVILVATSGQLPVAFEVRKVVDIGGRFRGAKTFVEDVVKGLPGFYGEVGQFLQAWVPKAPKINEKPESSDFEVPNAEPNQTVPSDSHDPAEPDQSSSIEGSNLRPTD